MFLGESANRLHLLTIQKPDAKASTISDNPAGCLQMFENLHWRVLFCRESRLYNQKNISPKKQREYEDI
jgi:hypothetical protein